MTTNREGPAVDPTFTPVRVSEAPECPLDVEGLYRAHAAFVAGFLRRLGVASSDLPDVLQEVFLVAHRKGGWSPGPARPRTWLAGIALREALAHARRRRKHATLAGEGGRDQPTSEAVPERELDRRETVARVRRAIATLDPEHAAVFMLYELEGRPCPDIAAGLGIPIGTVYSRLHAARRAFRRAWERGVLVEEVAEVTRAGAARRLR